MRKFFQAVTTARLVLTVVQIIVLAILVIAMSACSGADGPMAPSGKPSSTITPSPSPAPVPSSQLRVNPSNAAMRVGQSLVITASGGDGWYTWETNRMLSLDVRPLTSNRSQIEITLLRLPLDGDNTGVVVASSSFSSATTTLTFLR